jgi:two-component system chemotaxis response regulator CheY
MRLHANDAQTLIATLAAAIQKDPASLEHWRCLHLQIQCDSKTGSQEECLTVLSTHYKELDCDVICCPDKDILIISREPDIHALYDLAEDIAGTLAEHKYTLDIGHYELFYDWRSIRSLLKAKAGDASLPSTTMPDCVVTGSSEFFQEIESLQEVFQLAQNAKNEKQLPLQVMLVEDDPVTRRMVSNIFKDKYAMITAKDALEAVANYMMYAPDIVFLDINLPDVSGFHVLHQIMACDPHAYVVMFSGHGYLDNITTALGNGASGFVAKPFRKEKLTHYIQDCALQQRRFA